MSNFYLNSVNAAVKRALKNKSEDSRVVVEKLNHAIGIAADFLRETREDVQLSAKKLIVALDNEDITSKYDDDFFKSHPVSTTQIEFIAEIILKFSLRRLTADEQLRELCHTSCGNIDADGEPLE